MSSPEGFVIDPDGLAPLDFTAGSTPVPQVTNLVPNPGFEHDTVGSAPAGWTASPGVFLTSGATLTCQSSSPMFGSQDMKIVSTAVTGEGAAASLPGTFSINTNYTFTIYLRGNAGGEQVKIGIGNAGNNTFSSTKTLTTGWQSYSLTWLCPNNITSGVYAYVELIGASVQTVYVDGAQVIQGSAAVTYFDGDTPGYKWSGTIGNSSSLPLPGWGSLRLAALTIPPAPKRPEWASNADTDGQALVRNPYHDNRQCTMDVRVNATNMDDAMTALGVLQGKLQEACIQGANNGPGLKCNWTPAGSSHTLALYMVYAEITDMPITYADGWFANRPVVTVAFQAKPFLYGTEFTGPTVSASVPLETLEIDNVPGDVPAEARLVITDGASQPRRWVEWGLEQRYYNASSPAALFIDSASLVTSGFAGAGTAETGAYGGSVIGATLYPQTLGLCGTGNLSHVGSFRVKARILSSSPNQYWRLTWQAADGDFISNDWVQPVTPNIDYSELDFGLVTIPPVEAGTQKWTGRVEAYSTDTSGLFFGGVDWLALIPANEGYGRLEAAYSYTPGVLNGYDNFTLGAPGSALNGVAASTGGTWATSGATTDFVYFTDGDGNNWAKRSTTADSGYRFAILGTATPTDVEVGAKISASLSGEYDMALVAHWTNSSNYLRLTLEVINDSLFLFLHTIVSGTGNLIASSNSGTSTGLTPASLRLIAYGSGRALGWVLDSSGATILSVDGNTNGFVLSGKSGFADLCNFGGSPARLYGQFYTATPQAEPLIIHTTKSLEVRSDANLRQSSDGASYGDIPSRGSRLFIPQSGAAGRSTRIAVRAIREDPVTSASRNDGDSTSLAVFYTPRYLAVPRS